jgi:hypothetical protein
MSRKNKNKWKPLRSGLEREIHDQLVEAGVEFGYETEKLEYRKRVVRGICKCGNTDVFQRKTYTPDFILANGIYIEVKGRLTSQDRSKLLLVKQQHPNLDLRIIFGANNKIHRDKQKRYAQWASENGIKFGIKQIPESWLKK